MRHRFPPSRSQRVVQRFASTVEQVSVSRSGTTYKVAQAKGRGRYWEMDFRQFTGSGGGAVNGPLTHRLGVALQSVDDDDASVTHTGAWTAASAITSAYGSDYHFTDDPGAFVTWTTPAGSTSVAAHLLLVNNGGFGLPSIDGDNSLCNRCPTAQELVDGGTLPSTALIANGGDLDPATRLIDFYNSATLGDVPTLMADGLPEAAHEVRVDRTGHKRAANTSGEARIYSAGYMAGDDGTLITDTDAGIAALKTLQSSNSALEYAWQVLPSGATTSTLVGSVHGSEVQDSFDVFVDGAPVTLADGERVTGTTVVIEKATHLLHPQTGATHIATVDVTYTFDPNGFVVSHTMTPLVPMRIDLAYVHMFPVDADIFTRACSTGLSTPITLDNDDDLFYGAARAHAAWMWDPVSGCAVLVQVPNVVAETNSWQRSSPHFLDFQDRETGQQVSKVYVARVGNPATPENVVAGVPLGPFVARYQATLLDDAEAALATA